MTKSDLVARIAKIYPYMNVSNVDRVVSIIIGKMIETLKEGSRIELRGFGSFVVRVRAGTEKRNPKTGDKVYVKTKKVPYFKAGKQLKDLLNGNASFEE